MLGVPLKNCVPLTKYMNPGVLAISNNIGVLFNGYKRNYSKDKDSCCKDIAQSKGRQIEAWPRSESPPPAWRSECPQDPQPPNYDPYRIKVPETVVPPLPPSNVKWTGVWYTTSRQGYDNEQMTPSHSSTDSSHMDPSKTQPQAEEEPESRGLLELLKSIFGRSKPKDGQGSDVASCDSEIIDYDKIITKILPKY